ncbi:hypothetical protein [Escherichia phage wV7]|uniref:Uncharacterized protein n=1 Tax=Escherichia phage wV7 TaxID=1054480 RepID=G0X5F8_9CAUD|nr:hypothetical protein F412_gp239 [Escherichia phage wV7]AEM00697.1 hypothetical protein [Escherichia phage wV7]AKE46050.1 hypothetical protein ECTP7_01183 [Escherichia coli O157 typing phage 7]
MYSSEFSYLKMEKISYDFIDEKVYYSFHEPCFNSEVGFIVVKDNFILKIYSALKDFHYENINLKFDKENVRNCAVTITGNKGTYVMLSDEINDLLNDAEKVAIPSIDDQIFNAFMNRG